MLAKMIEFPSKNLPARKEASLGNVLGFLNRVSAFADSAADFNSATTEIFREVCAFTHWPIAHLYSRTDEGEQFVSNDIWFLEDGLDPTAIEEFRTISEETVFEKGKGLIGLIAEEQKAKAVADVTLLPQFLRGDAARRSGVCGFFGFPILVRNECIAVAEFYGREKATLDPTSLEIMQYVSSQLARLYEREKNLRHQKQLIAQFDSSVQTCIENLVNGSQKLHKAGDGVQTQAEQTDLQCAKVSQGSQSISGNMNSLQDAMERLMEVEAQTVRSGGSVRKTVDKLSKDVVDALAELQKLGKLTANIESIAKNVSDISAQVRMLGLNASIEAARAGQAGKGFAIVASEIKSLALQSETSSQAISAQLGDILKIAHCGTDLMHTVNNSMQVLEDCTNQLGDVINHQHDATETISKNLSDAQDTFADIECDIESMGAASRDLLGLSHDVGAQVEAIKALSSDITLSSNRFIEALKN